MGFFKLKKEEKDSNSIKEAVTPLKSEAEVNSAQSSSGSNSDNNLGSASVPPKSPQFLQNNTPSFGTQSQSFRAPSTGQQQVASSGGLNLGHGSASFPNNVGEPNSVSPFSSPIGQQERMAAPPQPSQSFPNGSFQADSFGGTEASLSRDEVQEMIEETIERVIDEELHKLTSSVKKVVVWKENVESEIAALKEDILNLKEGFDRLEKRVLGKINDYDKNILDVNSEIKALEKVFQKITPTLVNNVNELSRIARMLKESVPKKDEV